MRNRALSSRLKSESCGFSADAMSTRTKRPSSKSKEHTCRGFSMESDASPCRARLGIGEQPGAKAEVNAGLAAMIAEAFAIRNQLLSGSDDSIEAMTERIGMGKGHLTSLVRLSYLAPDIVRALLEGRQPIELTPHAALATEQGPGALLVQRHFLGFADGRPTISGRNAL
jgi:hypothetical protein